MGLMLVGLLVLPQTAAPAEIEVDGDCTLVDAITAANEDTATGDCPAGSGADTIELTVNVTLTEEDNDDDFGPRGLPVIYTEVTIKGKGFEIARDDEADEFGIFAVSEDGELLLFDTEVSGGSVGDDGGGIANAGTTTLDNCMVHDNEADEGGGIANEGTLILIHSEVYRNEAYWGGGGIVSEGTLILTGSDVIDNYADDLGGGIYAEDIATLTNSTVSDNTALNGGGGIYQDHGTLTLIDSEVSDNGADIKGGGIAVDGGTTMLTDSEVSGNEAGDGDGGGFWLAEGAKTTLTNSTVSGNEADFYGGGIFITDESTLTLTNSTVSDNDAGERGGGIFGDGDKTALINSTVSGNEAFSGDGGGIYADGMITTLTNSIVADSEGGDCYGTVSDEGNNFSEDGSCPGATITPGTDFDIVLRRNGGPTKTHALLLGSVAVNAAGICGLATDQRGVERSAGQCDSGSFEFAPEEQIEALGFAVQDLVDRGFLKKGQAKGLIQPLNNAYRSLERGGIEDACNQLQDFIDEVSQKVVDGALGQPDADVLIAAANVIRSDLDCP
jgi:parallel beta-helix repeat protein